MKITDIINEAESKIVAKAGSIPVIRVDTLPLGSTKDTENTRYKGMGIQTLASQHNKSAAIIKHTELVDGLEDAALKFINVCMFNADNPWLPTYNKAKIYYDGKNYMLVSTSDPLSGNMRDYKGDQRKLQMMASVKLSKVGEAELKRKNPDLPPPVEGKIIFVRLNAKAHFLVENLLDGMKSKFKQIRHFYDDPHLLKAMDILDQFNDSVFDMHAGNFMWRGSQLVINDPVYSRPNAVKKEQAPVKKNDYEDQFGSLGL